MNTSVKILAALAILFFCIQVFSYNKADVDLWGNIGFVTSPPWTENFKYVNTFSFTEPGHPWFNHEWLGQYILRLTYLRGGSTGLLLLKILLGLCVVGMIYLAMRESCKSPPVKFLWLFLVISTMGYGFSTRPHLFTYALYAFFLLTLRKNRTLKARHLFILPLLGILWVNIHGAFFIGLILLVLYLILNRERRRLTSITIALFLAASFINPYGYRLWEFLSYSASIFRPHLSEWAPFTRIEYLAEHADFAALSILSIFAVSCSRRQKEVSWLAILAASFLSAIAMRRNIPLFAITAAFVVPPHLEDAAGKPVEKISGRLSQPALAVILSLFIVISGYYAVTFDKADPLKIEIPQERFPAGLISFMKENEISGNAFVFFDWAEYCIWKLYPGCRVFLDGRLCSAYGPKTINDYFNFLYLEGDWENALEDYPTDIVLIHQKNPVYARMLSRRGWKLVGEDKIAGLFLKEGGHPEFFTKLERGEIKYPRLRRQEYFP